MPHRRSQLRSLLRALGALLVCLGLGAGSLAAAGGRGSDPAGAVLAAARTHVGDAYVWGGTGPHSWDCSGLTSTLWRTVGRVQGIPRTAQLQYAWSVPIPKQQLLPGDLVFFGSPVSHVGIYAGHGAMVDAGSSRGRVTERPIWPGGVFHYGRVPRAGMPKVQPWAGRPRPPMTRPAPPPAPRRRSRPAPRRPPPPAPRHAGPTTSGLAPLAGLPDVQRHASTGTALRAARAARARQGSRQWTDATLVRAAWRQAGGRALPASRPALVTRGHEVRRSDARVGDLVVYGRPAVHVGFYLGHGLMVDASRVLGRVVIRRVFSSETVHLLRLPS